LHLRQGTAVAGIFFTIQKVDTSYFDLSLVDPGQMVGKNLPF
jgi:hypothetical protein